MGIKEELSADVKKDGGGKDELEALDALEKEASEFNKVCLVLLSCQVDFNTSQIFTDIPVQDAEIDRILKAFRLDA